MAAGQAFALAPPHWPRPEPAGVTWSPLAGDPLVRRTWAVWPAESRRRDLALLVAALERGASGQSEEPAASPATGRPVSGECPD